MTNILDPESANQLRDAVALGRLMANGDSESVYLLAEAADIPIASRDLIWATAFVIGWMAIDLAGEYPSRFPAIEDVWRDLLDRIAQAENEPRRPS